ncbi:sulfide/dihydroorotate dehydrogenase-like FAD/NAD-binding protein [Methanomicrobium antiquum]|uniref:Sulfide/dihydroorotate dehydrogenase-like FAD/NAD-binding protein n=1 Tax=Methanomicrobium antiquum TaxID=487686 RepID=A0AAF0FKY8_9EURY|nr:sulfide/dihydroorotate dehydrogenase-like FAD/NAD-binding protein [Methanomicrobium antiquum]WFN35955.1 sulfide/dihydroorotate dehydrogenase-like FAD/NAD-binding protein [Methanomicrobium antiquum]
MAYKIEKASEIADNIFEFWIKAPHVSKNAQAGQFVVIRIDEKGERIPLTISAAKDDLIRIVFMAVGKTTKFLSSLKEGESVLDVAGPLGQPGELKKWGNCVLIGGGVGIACLPILAKALKEQGNQVTGIIGARNENLLLLSDELEQDCDELVICTDDGSRGFHGFPADILKKKLEDEKIDCVWIIGPAIMMKITSMATIPSKTKTFVSLNPIMVDGTGMCGSCRVSVGGETKFACVDGPEFDAHLVDWDELMNRQRIYPSQEKESLDNFNEHHHHCRCGEHHHE